jgi:hypothetical protein
MTTKSAFASKGVAAAAGSSRILQSCSLIALARATTEAKVVPQPVAMLGPHRERAFGGGEGPPRAAGILPLLLEQLD